MRLIKNFSALSLLLIANVTLAQFGIINDPDGFVLVRHSAEKTSSVTDTLYKTDYFYSLDNENDWLLIDYDKGNGEKTGYIHASRAQFLEGFSAVPVFTKTNKSLILKTETVEVLILFKDFDAKRNAVQYKKEENYVFVELINNKKFYGTDGELPTRQYDKITITFDSQEIAIPESALSDLFQPNLHMVKVNFNEKEDKLYISSFNSDGAGGYFVLWVIENGKYKTRFVAYGF